LAVAAVLLQSCLGGNKAVYTGPPPREEPLDSGSHAGPAVVDLRPDSLTLNFDVPGDTACRVIIDIHRSSTRKVRNLVDSVLPPGHYEIDWWAVDQDHRKLPPRKYYYSKEICGQKSTESFYYRDTRR